MAISRDSEGKTMIPSGVSVPDKISIRYLFTTAHKINYTALMRGFLPNKVTNYQ